MANEWQVRVNSVGKVICAPDWSWDTAPGLLDYDLITILKGQGIYRIDAETYPAKPGVCMLLRKGQRIIGSMDLKNPMVMLFTHFDFLDEKDQPITPPLSSIPSSHRLLNKPGFFYDLLAEIFDAFQSRKNDSANDWMKVVLLNLLKQEANTRWAGYQQEQADAIKSLCARISQDPGKSWRIHILAEEFNCTPDHFGKLFQKYVGESASDFIIQSRINAARSLLQSSSHSIIRIAELLGYSDVYAFSRQFRQKTGMTPSACRKNKSSLSM
jgi:AraC-like DNA-binding protein